MEELVTIVLPTYNGERYLGLAIESVLNQTYNNLEVIVVDDCSRDRTVEILNSISDERLHVIVLEQNGGACRARNIGVSHARGEWIAFQDSDDEWLPDNARRQIPQGRRYEGTYAPGTHWLSCGARPQDEGNGNHHKAAGAENKGTGGRTEETERMREDERG